MSWFARHFNQLRLILERREIVSRVAKINSMSEQVAEKFKNTFDFLNVPFPTIGNILIEATLINLDSKKLVFYLKTNT